MGAKVVGFKVVPKAIDPYFGKDKENYHKTNSNFRHVKVWDNALAVVTTAAVLLNCPKVEDILGKMTPENLKFEEDEPTEKKLVEQGMKPEIRDIMNKLNTKRQVSKFRRNEGTVYKIWLKYLTDKDVQNATREGSLFLAKRIPGIRAFSVTGK